MQRILAHRRACITGKGQAIDSLGKKDSRTQGVQGSSDCERFDTDDPYFLTQYAKAEPSCL